MKRSRKPRTCPRCAGRDIALQDSMDGVNYYVCTDCDFEFEVSGSRSSDRDEDYCQDIEFDPETSEEEWEQ